MDWLLVSLICLLPCLPALAGIVAGARPARCARSIALAGATSAALMAWIAAGAALAGANLPAASRGLFLYDRLTAVMTILITFVGWVVTRFSQRYLEGDPREARYYRWLLLTLAAVLGLVSAGHLLVLAVAWVGTSLCLHQLLLHDPGRPGAVFAARKKFVISRLGDACIFIAAALLWQRTGTLELQGLFANAAVAPAGMAGPAMWLVLGAALKSAQVPFHSWLPDTMETPTPVSAFMHAGIVNAGGFLIIRLYPLIEKVAPALTALVACGALTAAFGALVMLTQPTVKRALAYSTIAQMGFMLLECGLGAFGLATLHLVAHSIYKVRAFLYSGSTLAEPPRAALPLRTPALLGGLAGAAVLIGLSPGLFGATSPGGGVFALVTGLAVSYGLGRLWSAAWNARTLALGAVLAIGFFALAHVVERAANWMVPPIPPAPSLVVAASLVFIALYAAQVSLWRAERHAWSRHLYLHALHGFYLGTLANRLLRRLWPAEAAVPPFARGSAAAVPNKI